MPTRKPMTNVDDSLSSFGHNSDRDSIFNLPTTTKRPYTPPSTRPTYPPVNPYSGGQGGGSNYFGGGGSHIGGGGGGYSKPTTPSSGGGFFSGILGGLQDSLTNYAKNRIAEAITGNRGGTGGSTGGSGGLGGLGSLGGLFDTKSIQNRITGGLFSENKSPSSSQTSSNNMHSTRPAYYPTQPPAYMNRGSNLPYPTTNTRGQSQPTPPHYGWKLD